MPALPALRREVFGTAAYDSESNRDAILIYLGLPFGLALLAISLRFYVRTFMLRFLGSDDWTMLAAGLCAIATYACVLAQNENGLGRHMSSVSSTQLMNYNRDAFVFRVFSVAGVCLFRISLCLSLIRVAKYRTYAWILRVIIRYHLALELVVFLSCVPIQAVWDTSLRGSARCIPAKAFMGLALGVSIVNLVINVALILVPIPVILSLTLNLRTKFALCFVNLFGFVVVGAAAMKIKYQLSDPNEKDRLFHANYPVWSAIELYFGILATSLPTLRPLFSWLLDTARSTIEDTTEAVRRAASRQSRPLDEIFKEHIGPTTYTTECTSDSMNTPDSKDMTSYFSIFRPRKLSCREILTYDSNDTIVESKAPRDLEEQREREHHRRQASRILSGACKGKDSFTVTRTSRMSGRSSISRVYELTGDSPPSPLSPISPISPISPLSPLSPPSPLSPSAKLSNSSASESSLTAVDEGPEEAPRDPWHQQRTPSRLRKMSSSDAGMVLRAAMQSQADLPRSPSIEDMMRTRCNFKV